jgi:hypothetical protein
LKYNLREEVIVGKRKKSRLAVILLLSMLFGTVSGAWAEQKPGLYSREIEKAVEYLHKVQNDDGGFPYLPGQDSSQAVSCWVIMALAEAGEDINAPEWAPAGNTPLDFLHNSPEDLLSSCDLARTLLALSAGEAGTEYQGVDLVEQILSLQQADGHFAWISQGEEALINAHIWSVLALHSAGQSIPELEKARQWLLDCQNPDGGFGWVLGIPSDGDDTAAAIRALLLMGEDENSPAIQRGLTYLKSCQGEDGGFNSGYMNGDKSNASTDAWVIQALLSSGQSPWSPFWTQNSQRVLDHLLGLQDRSGFFYYTAGVAAAPVQTTAMVLITLSQLAQKVQEIEPEGPAEKPGFFTDLSNSYWAYHEIMELLQAGILTGYSDGSFKPEKSVSRAEFATMIVKGLGLAANEYGSESQFKDLAPGFWALASIQLCVEKGYVNGMPGGIFQPNGNITGAQLAAILVRTGPGAPEPISGPRWYEELVKLAGEKGLLYPGFDPHAPASRAQCAYSIMKLRSSLGLN